VSAEAEQRRARDEVRAWRAAHPDGTRDEMLADVAADFPTDYRPLLLGTLYMLDQQRAGTGAAPGSDGSSR
jgi:hypothetical protein